MVKTQEAGHSANRAVYLAIGVNTDGLKAVLGLWTAAIEGAKFWRSVVTDLKNRGVADILIACVDGLKGSRTLLKRCFRAPRCNCVWCATA